MNNIVFNTEFRDPSIVMKDSRIGAMHQNRISFVRSIVRKMANENWKVTTHSWNMDKDGLGSAVYRIKTEYSVYNFIVFSNQIENSERIDRVIAEKWDVTFTLTQGDVDDELLEQMRINVPLQEAGRNNSKTMILSRANKSVRVFDSVIESLSSGQQPDISSLLNVGYILRTTAVYGNGKFGIADFDAFMDNPDFKLAFSPQMCACYLLRQFSIDWVNYIAKEKSDKAVTLDDDIARFIGTGNATGLGMAPYLLNHPQIIDAWMTAREKCIVAVGKQTMKPQAIKDFHTIIQKAIWHLGSVKTIDENQQRLNEISIEELEGILKNKDTIEQGEWRGFINKSEDLSYETQEIILSSIIEIYPDLVDGFENEMNAKEKLSLDDGLTIADIKEVIKNRYKWATDIDFSDEDSQFYFWYRSEVKEEPRIGVRATEEGQEKEMRLDIARQVNTFNLAIKDADPEMQLVDFLLNNSKFRVIARRIWTMGSSPMGDIQMNVLHKDMLPIDLLRCKLAVFGAAKFDPRSDKWVRVTLFQGAPLLKDINDEGWLFTLPPKAVLC